MTKPPAGSSLLFGALADSGRIKKDKNNTHKMEIRGIDEITWFTDHPDRNAGEWEPTRLAKKWRQIFSYSQPNAQATFKINGKRMILTFEMFPPVMSGNGRKMDYKIRSLGDCSDDIIGELKASDKLNEISLFIDNSTPKSSSVTCPKPYHWGMLPDSKGNIVECGSFSTENQVIFSGGYCPSPYSWGMIGVGNAEKTIECGSFSGSNIVTVQ